MFVLKGAKDSFDPALSYFSVSWTICRPLRAQADQAYRNLARLATVAYHALLLAKRVYECVNE